MAATDDETFARDVRIAGGEEADDLIGRKRCLLVERGECGRDVYGVEGSARGLEECFGAEAGAGAVNLPLMLEQAAVGIDVLI